jgi:hypothetical protein
VKKEARPCFFSVLEQCLGSSSDKQIIPSIRERILSVIAVIFLDTVGGKHKGTGSADGHGMTGREVLTSPCRVAKSGEKRRCHQMRIQMIRLLCAAIENA